MSGLTNTLKKITANQQGLASVVVVTVLVVLLTLISVGFARLMSRSVNNSTNSQLSTSATYAAQSGINDTIAYLQKNLNPKDPQGNATADIEATQCNQLLDANDTKKINPYFAGNGNTNEKYTCLLVNSQPDTLFYQKLPVNESQIIKMTTNPSNIGSLLLSWQSADNPQQNAFPAAGTTTLPTETAWNTAKYAPLLRVTLYPMPNDSGNYDPTAVQSASKTFYLYPISNSSSHSWDIFNGMTDGSVANVSCNTNTGKSISHSTAPVFNFNYGDSNDFNCNAVISNLQTTGANYFYVRVTPLYDQASVKIKATDTSGNSVKFVNVQAVVDVTAKVNTATKRLRARVELNGTGSQNVPESNLRSAETICKRLQYNQPASSVQVDGSVCANQLNINQALPNIFFCVNSSPCNDNAHQSTTLNNGDSANLSWAITNADNCTPSETPDNFSWAGPSGSGNGNNVNTGALTGDGDYNYTIVCSNSVGSVGQTVRIHVNAPITNGGVPECTGQECLPSNCSAGVELFPDPGFQENPDWTFVWTADNTNNSDNFYNFRGPDPDRGFDDQASSISIPQNCVVTLYKNPNYSGPCINLTAGQAGLDDFGQLTWSDGSGLNNSASSIHLSGQPCSAPITSEPGSSDCTPGDISGNWYPTGGQSVHWDVQIDGGTCDEYFVLCNVATYLSTWETDGNGGRQWSDNTTVPDWMGTPLEMDCETSAGTWWHQGGGGGPVCRTHCTAVDPGFFDVPEDQNGACRGQTATFVHAGQEPQCYPDTANHYWTIAGVGWHAADSRATCQLGDYNPNRPNPQFRKIGTFTADKNSTGVFGWPKSYFPTNGIPTGASWNMTGWRRHYSLSITCYV